LIKMIVNRKCKKKEIPLTAPKIRDQASWIGKLELWGIWVPLAEVILWAFSGNLRLNPLFYLFPVSDFVSYDSGDLCILVESN
jgi:hypothetical protein